MINLSKELCEICGIERKGKLIFRKRGWDGRNWISAGRGYKEFDFESIPEVTVDIIPTAQWNKKNGFQYPYTYIEKIKKLYDEHGYDFVEFNKANINFEQPENFVKLFELNIPDSSVTVGAAICFCNRRHLNNRDDFLESVIQLAKYNNDIKQAIKETEWVYE